MKKSILFAAVISLLASCTAQNGGGVDRPSMPTVGTSESAVEVLSPYSDIPVF